MRFIVRTVPQVVIPSTFFLSGGSGCKRSARKRTPGRARKFALAEAVARPKLGKLEDELPSYSHRAASVRPRFFNALNLLSQCVKLFVSMRGKIFPRAGQPFLFCGVCCTAKAKPEGVDRLREKIVHRFYKTVRHVEKISSAASKSMSNSSWAMM